MKCKNCNFDALHLQNELCLNCIKSEKAKGKKDFINRILEFEPNASIEVLNFIFDFGFHTSIRTENYENIRRLFMDGYCYYFALMLQDAFRRGQICWCAPFGHICWVDQDIPYDIEGVCFSEYEYLIPISYLGDMIDDFRRVPNLVYNATQKEIQNVIKIYKKDNNFK